MDLARIGIWKSTLESNTDRPNVRQDSRRTLKSENRTCEMKSEENAIYA